MSNSNANGKSTGIILGAAAVLLLTLLYFAFGRGDQEEKVISAESSPAPKAASNPAPEVRTAQEAAAAQQAAAPRRPTTPEDLDRMGEPEATLANEDPRYRREPEQVEMPEQMRREIEDAMDAPTPGRVLADFENPYVQISDSELAEVEANANPEIPEHIQQELDAAQNREMPPDVKAAFENPYVEISEEELEMLREAGRVGQ